MRTSVILFASVVASCGAAPSFALEAGDTMASWQSASAEEKKKLVSAILNRTGEDGRTVSVIGCLDAASHAPGHGDLPIVEVAEACARDTGEPT